MATRCFLAAHRQVGPPGRTPASHTGQPASPYRSCSAGAASTGSTSCRGGRNVALGGKCSSPGVLEPGPPPGARAPSPCVAHSPSPHHATALHLLCPDRCPYNHFYILS